MLLAMYLQVSLLFFIWTGALTLKICSFNIQSFGESKVAKPEILDVIGKCISRCDIALVMEIKDASGKVFPQLMTHLNSQLNRKKDQYKYVISERLGRKSYKEQYAFIFREKLVSLQAVYQYPDQQEEGEVEDSFAREPFISWFTSSRTAIKNFVIIPIHTAPEAAVREIDALYDVYMSTTQRWKIENIIIMGDFNADCGYVPKKKWRNIRLKSNSSFVWLINDESDTTVKESTHCAYDRIVLHGQNLVQAVDPKSVKIYDFKTAYGLTEKEALAVSDHFPVAFTVSSGREPSPLSKSPKKRARKKTSSASYSTGEVPFQFHILDLDHPNLMELPHCCDEGVTPAQERQGHLPLKSSPSAASCPVP